MVMTKISIMILKIVVVMVATMGTMIMDASRNAWRAAAMAIIAIAMKILPNKQVVTAADMY